MIRGKLKSGFQYEIDEKSLDNMEFIEALADAEGDDPLAFIKVINILLGKEQKLALYNILRNKDGRVPIEATAQAVAEIMESAGEEVKNLDSSQAQ